MFRVSREIEFCYGHRLLNHAGKCRHLHGHSGRAVITLESAALDECGMVADFAELKRVVGGWIDERLDHRMILQRSDPFVAIFQQHGEPLLLMDEHPTAENIARLIFEFAASRGFPVVECQLWESPQSWASYRPSP
jgi:6-pyruvoyltetrahydropterin/6-carboxytetrahydropterin synthase